MYNPSEYKGGTKKPYDSYVCHNCNKRGHFKWQCNAPRRENTSTNEVPSRIKRPTGIPMSFMKPVEADSKNLPPGAMVTDKGNIVVNKLDA